MPPVSLVLGLGLIHSCPWLQKGLFSEGLSSPWPRIFFVFLALASSLVFSTPPLLVSSYECQRWSPRGRPWPRGREILIGHISKSLALASKLKTLENCPVLGSRTALFLNARNLAENLRTLFLFSSLGA